MNCDQIFEILASYMLNNMSGTPGQPLSDHVVAHLLSCATCREQMDIMTHITADCDLRLSRPMTCEEVLDLIAEMAETDKRQAPYRFPAAWLHLARCHECREVYEMTRTTLTPEDEEAFTPVLQSALPFKPIRQEVWQQVSPLVRKLSSELTIRMNRGKDALRFIPEWLASTVLTPIPATAYRSEGENHQYLQEINVNDEDNHRQFIVQVQNSTGDTMHLRAKVFDTDFGSNLGGIAVALLDEQNRYLIQTVTPEAEMAGDNGWVRFENCWRGRYTVRITEQERAWELALHLS